MKNPSEFKVVQLKKRLAALGLSSSGSKAELIGRLTTADPTGKWMDDIEEIDESQADESDLEENAVGGASSVNVADNTNLLREVELLRRERSLMQRELGLMQRENELLRNSPQSDISSHEVRPEISVQAVTELLCNFDGSNPLFSQWERQVKLLCSTYQLDDNAAKVLIGARSKGKALAWLHSRSEYIEMPLTDLLREMKNMFEHRPNKMILRREFEERTWKYGETFGDYYHAKIIMANNVPIEDEEIIDYLIDGIPETQLRNQARMQCFATKTALFAAFEKITISDRRDRSGRDVQRGRIETTTLKLPHKSMQYNKETTGRQNKDIRCYNCSKMGHLSKDCKKPRREKGTCFKCGEFGHIIKNCPKKEESHENQVNHVSENSSKVCEFKEMVTFEKNLPIMTFHFELETLIDTGSPITFIKEKYIPISIRDCIDSIDNRYCGINDSKLNVLGTTNLDMIFRGTKKKNVRVYIVSDDTMSMSAVVGRDVLKLFNLRLTEPLEEEINDSVAEIMNIDFVEPEKNAIDKLNVSSDITSVERLAFENLFNNEYVHASRPDTPNNKTELKLVLADTKPFNYTPRRLSHFEKSELRKILDNLLDKGIIRESESEFASPIVLVKKKNGEIRMCVDYRTLNKAIARENFPIPLIEDQLETMRDKFYFSILDLKDGFYHIDMASESIPYTSFVTPLGQFEFKKMPFGLKPAPQKFQRHIHTIFKELIDAGDIIVYIDDFVVATVTFEEHLRVLKRVFKLLTDNHLVLRIDKCKFLYTSIDYLGYTITKDGISPTKNGIDAVRNFPIPTNIKSVQSFLGLSSYFRKFIEKFSIIAKPLYDLLRKGSDFKWDDAELNSFEKLKLALIAAPVLAIYNPQDLTELHCDASSKGFGAILMQRKADMKYHPIFFFSKRTTDTESRYHSFELETMAIIYALRRFRNYLVGINFKIITDCNALKLTLNKKDLNPRISRWALELENYDYTVEHRNGERMRHVDALSRMTNILVIEDNPFEVNISLCQSQDEKIKKLREELENREDSMFEMRNGLVYRKKGDDLLFYVPGNMESNVMYRYHDSMGHLGSEKTRDIIKRTYWFPQMRQKIDSHVKNCLKCISFSPTTGKQEGFLHPISKGNLPFMILHIDHYGPVDRQRLVKQYIFLIVDSFTKFVKLYATKSTSTKEVIACLSEYFTYYSRPHTIVSDRGSSFTSKDFEDFMLTNGIKHVKIATGSPKANGQVERINRVITPMLAKLTDSSTNNHWYKVLDEVEYAINNCVHKTTREIPSKLLFGVEQRGKVTDCLKEYLSNDVSNEVRNLEVTRKSAEKKIEKSQEYSKAHYDRKRKEPHVYETGDFVMVKNFENTAGISKKLIPQYKGPYEVKRKLRNDRYVLGDIAGFQMTQKPYLGTWEVSNMKPWQNK